MGKKSVNLLDEENILEEPTNRIDSRDRKLASISNRVAAAVDGIEATLRLVEDKEDDALRDRCKLH